MSLSIKGRPNFVRVPYGELDLKIIAYVFSTYLSFHSSQLLSYLCKKFI